MPHCARETGATERRHVLQGTLAHPRLRPVAACGASDIRPESPQPTAIAARGHRRTPPRRPCRACRPDSSRGRVGQVRGSSRASAQRRWRFGTGPHQVCQSESAGHSAVRSGSLPRDDPHWESFASAGSRGPGLRMSSSRSQAGFRWADDAVGFRDSSRTRGLGSGSVAPAPRTTVNPRDSSCWATVDSPPLKSTDRRGPSFGFSIPKAAPQMALESYRRPFASRKYSRARPNPYFFRKSLRPSRSNSATALSTESGSR
jgi:hypothetical protein